MDHHLLIETSSRAGAVGLMAAGVLHCIDLNESSRHARDLAASARRLMADQGLGPANISSMIVSLGPGGYTGLRVGLASAKAFAYALGCSLVAVPTFLAIAQMTEGVVEIMADALQGLAYVQTYEEQQPVSELRIVDLKVWRPGAKVLGPGAHLVPGATLIKRPSMEALWQASRMIAPASREELFALEPLYLRGSSAEEQRKTKTTIS